MRIKVQNQPNLLSGLFFMTFGIGVAVYASAYEMGTARQMGPGYFPTLLGGMLAVIGVIVALKSLSMQQEEEQLEKIYLKPLVLILGSIILFGAMLMPLGLVLSSIVLIGISAYASHEFNLKYVVPMMIVLIVGCYLVFVYGLGMLIPMWIGG